MLGAKADYFHPVERIRHGQVVGLENKTPVIANNESLFGELKVAGLHFNINFLIISFDDTKANVGKTLITVKKFKSDQSPYLDRVALETIASPKSKPEPFFVINFNTKKEVIEIGPNDNLIILLKPVVNISPEDIDITFKGYRFA